jgi:hypothetical protein
MQEEALDFVYAFLGGFPKTMHPINVRIKPYSPVYKFRVHCLAVHWHRGANHFERVRHLLHNSLGGKVCAVKVDCEMSQSNFFKPALHDIESCFLFSDK